MTACLSVSGLLKGAVGAFTAAGLENPPMEARALAEAILGIGREAMLADPEHVPSTKARQDFADALRRRCAGEPLARIVGEKEFWSLPFLLGAEALVPRPDSECVVEAVLDHLPDRARRLSILDLGTGSGCLLLALLTELPAARGVGVDCIPGAVAIAAANAERLGLSNRASLRVGDWDEGLEGTFDVIVSNPPYVAERDRDSLPPEVRRHDPPTALFGGPDGLGCYRSLAPVLARRLAPDGIAVVELGAGQADDVASLVSESGLRAGAPYRDLAGVPRALPAARGADRLGIRGAKKKVGKTAVSV